MLSTLKCSLYSSNSIRLRLGLFAKQYTYFKQSAFKVITSTPKKPPIYHVKLVNLIGLSISGGVLYKTLNQHALCKASNANRLAGFRKGSEQNVHFNWKMLWYYLKPYLNYFLLAIAGALIVALLNIEIPHLMGNVINIVTKFTDSKDSEAFLNQMKGPSLKLIAMYIGQSFFTFFYIFALSEMAERMAFDMKKDLFSSIIKQDIEFFDEHRTGEIINRLTSDIQEFKHSFKQIISGGLRASTQIIGSSISLVLISPQMTFMTLLCVPTVIAVGTAFGAILRKTSRRAQLQNEKAVAVADEAVANIRTVRAFAMEDAEQKLYESEAFDAMILNEKLGFGIAFFQAGTNLFLNGIVLATVHMGGYLLSSNQLSPGQLMAYLMATQTIQRSMGQLSLLFGSVVRGLAAGGRVFEYINTEPKKKLTGGLTIPYHSLIGDLEFQDVCFAYPSRRENMVLEDFNLKIPAGKTVAIVGSSGNGKSTLVALLEGFYTLTSGSITLDGRDITTLDPSWLRQRVLGLISQEPILFGTTIMENIRYGKPGASDAEVLAAAKMANAHDFIMSFPDGYSTLVGERGASLSGGQKQRVAIARALLKKPTVLILDEATSALDAESENIVQHALDQACEGRTVIVVAHRLSTVRNADLIVVLHKGKVVEMGTDESLKKLKGHYYALTYAQSLGTN